MNDTDDDKPGANGTSDGSDTSGRVLHFDPKARERRKPKGRQGASSGNGKSPFAEDPIRSRVKEAHTGRFRVFRALQIAGVLFAFFVFLRSCGI